MALGVLNNLSAIYAENNLNNTNNNLQTVLQQLSSGSRINSGADDAAGLSLVNGLAANSAALTQSETNATEGVGLLQVADGALSQVTSLLNRAITLATEASNGTLNSTQEAGANQEYQSILAEITNIGSTTTYNQEQVFTGSDIAVYTGDSSVAGASIDDLNIRTLTQNSIGDTGGSMSYSTSQTSGSVFIDMTQNPTAGVAKAALTDTLKAATSQITVDTLNGTGGIESTTIKVGAGTSYADTIQGMIQAINAAGLGISASFTTAAIAGDANAALSTDTGIMITGSVGSGANPSASSYTGDLAQSGAAVGDSLSGTVSFRVGNGSTETVNMAAVNKATGGTTMSDLMSYINADTGLGVTAAVDGANDGLTLSSAAGSTQGLTVTSNLIDTQIGKAMAYTPTASYADGITGSNVEDFGINNVAANPQTALSPVDPGTATSASGTATISYTDSAGVSLSGTDLLDSADAQSSLTLLNTAIADVASLDGYIGAQINTLNSISQVMSTQQENVVSAQNAIQATDYAAATSNMSKYEILSQTGIAALAQANSVQQEVTKLLQ
jgi:flagellin